MTSLARHVPLAVIVVLFLFSIWIYSALVQKEERTLAVSFLNVGQGDSILVQTPSGKQMLIDGGSNRAVLRELSKIMPWYDRSLDIVVATHPDLDHIGGLIDVFERYRIDHFLESSVRDDGVDSRALENAVSRSEETQRYTVQRGDRIDFGDGVYFDILFPDRPLPSVETNTASIVGRVVWGNTAFLLTGDSPNAIEEYLVKLDQGHLRAQVLKVGHHGSKTSSSPLFVGFVNPEYAVYSRGCDNRYGHPHGDVIALYKKFGIQTLDTCTDGTITFTSNGERIELRRGIGGRNTTPNQLP